MACKKDAKHTVLLNLSHNISWDKFRKKKICLSYKIKQKPWSSSLSLLYEMPRIIFFPYKFLKRNPKIKEKNIHNWSLKNSL